MKTSFGKFNARYIFRVGLIPVETLPNEIDKQTSNMMVDMWANFATYGKPTPSPLEMLNRGAKKLESLVCILNYLLMH